MREIKALREKLGLSQKAVAAKMNVSQQAVSQWESDDGTPKAEQLPDLADLFGVSIDALFGRESKDTA